MLRGSMATGKSWSQSRPRDALFALSAPSTTASVRLEIERDGWVAGERGFGCGDCEFTKDGVRHRRL
jgi:hypothetical protein